MESANQLQQMDVSPDSWAVVTLPLALPNTYTYSIPSRLTQKTMVGCRAEVVFGKNKKYAGVISQITKVKPAFPTKPLLNIIDDQPLVNEKQLKLWQWMSDYYMCTEGEVMNAALPANFKLSSETILLFNEEADPDFSGLDDEEYLVAEALQVRRQLQLAEVQQILEVSHVYPVIKRLLEKNICFIWEQLQERYKLKKETFVSLHPSYQNEEALSELLNNWKGAPRQMELLLGWLHLQKTAGEVKKKDLLEKAGATSAQLSALCEKGILIAEKRGVNRIRTAEKKIQTDFVLSGPQENALNGINQVFSEKNVCLLHGVTGSGKTLIYIKLIEQCIRNGKQALYLLPEIALTAQIIRRLEKHFGGHIAIYHSKFNDQERVEIWNRIRNGEVSVVLGARSALLLPFADPGLLIVDEEHDASFKQQEPAPRYHARDTAIYYASLFGAKVLLGSGTPSLESYTNALNGKYGLVELRERYGGLELPSTEIVSSQAIRQQEASIISDPLKEKMEEALKAGKQVILFQNRRGYNPYIICGTCGYIPQCQHCDVSLTLHKYSNRLHCHYCGTVYPKLLVCNACGSSGWIEKNFGTEKIEEQLDQMFTGYRTGRMDVDSVKGKHAHDQLIQSFEQHRLDILVGTQMVVKGLDFDNVSLVGILDADGLLSFTDFRVNERAFQLMEQVSGRAGRKGKQGNVLIQALNVKHPILTLVQAHDYGGFYRQEMAGRQEFAYPPFTRLVVLTLKHKDVSKVRLAAEKLATSLRSDFAGSITGPAEPVIARVRNQYLMEILIRLPKESGGGTMQKKAIRHHMNLLWSDPNFKSIVIIADVDPV